MKLARLLFFPALACCAAPYASLAQVQTQRILLSPQATIPQKLIVKRGTVLEFYGELPDGETVLPTTFTIRSGTQVRATGSFKKTWSLKWDPSKESTATSYAMVFRADAGQQEARIARIGVTVIDSVPFKIASPKDLQEVSGVLPVEVAAIGAVKISGGEIFVDGAARGAKIGSDGKGTVNLLGLQPGSHTIVARIAVEGGGDFETEPAKVKLVADVAVQRTEVGPVDLRNGASHLQLKVALPDGMKAKAADFFLDGKTFAHSTSPPFAEVTLNPEGLGSGVHTLNIEVTTEDGEKHVSASVPFDVIGNPQADFEQWMEKFQRILEARAPMRANYDGALERFKADRTNVGELNEAVKKLRAADLNLEYTLTKLDPPTSLSAVDKNEISSALGELRASYARMVREEEALLRAISANVDYYDNLANINSALLKAGSAEERINSVGERLGNADAGRQQVGSALAYPANGNIKNDFPSMVQKLQQLADEAEGVRQQYNTDTANAANVLAVNKAISRDTWMANNIAKLALPRALTPVQRSEMTNILQGFSSAYRYRADGERILKRRLASALGIASNDSGLSGNVGVDGANQSALFNKAQLALAQAKSRLRDLSRKMGFGD